MPAPGFTFSLFHIHNRHSHHTTPHTQYNTIHTLILLSTHLHTNPLAGLENRGYRLWGPA